MQISAHSPLTLSRPRNSNCRKPGVGGDLLGIGTQHRTDVAHQRHQRAGIGRARLQVLGHDDLMRAIDRDLVAIDRNRWSRSFGPSC